MYFIEIPAAYWRRPQTVSTNARWERWIVRQMAQRVLVRQLGDMDDPATWVLVAESFGCRCDAEFLPFGSAGHFQGKYSPVDPESFGGRGLIEYNTALSPPAQARVIVHELMHHLLWLMFPGSLFGEPGACYYNDNALDVRHRLCRRAEDLCFRK